MKLGGMVVWKDNACFMYPKSWHDEVWGFWGDPDQGRPRADTIISSARVLERPGEAFTLVQCTGPDAQDVCLPIIYMFFLMFQIFLQRFKRDFRRLSRMLFVLKFDLPLLQILCWALKPLQLLNGVTDLWLQFEYSVAYLAQWYLTSDRICLVRVK